MSASLSSAFLGAFSFLSRLPLRSPELDAKGLALSTVFYPIVGATLGGCVGGLMWLVQPWFGWPMAVWCGIGLGALLTGALHEDGLADAADGLGGSASREKALAIMDDSRIGAFGAITLIWLFMARYFLLSAMGTEQALRLLPVVWAWARVAPVLLMAWLAPCRPGEGLAASVGKNVGARHAVSALFLATMITWVVVPPGRLCVAGGSLAATALAGLYFRRRLGGVSGDCLGAAVSISEIAALSGAIAWGRIAA